METKQSRKTNIEETVVDARARVNNTKQSKEIIYYNKINEIHLSMSILYIYVREYNVMECL